MNSRIRNTPAAKHPRQSAEQVAATKPAAMKRSTAKPSTTNSRQTRLSGGAAAPSESPSRGRADGIAADEAAHRWTFLTNHAHVLIVLHGSGDLVLREVARRVGITERAVQRIVQDLEQEGFIRREKVGRKNHYEVLMNRPLRHPLEAHRNIGDLLTLISGR